MRVKNSVFTWAKIHRIVYFRPTLGISETRGPFHKGLERISQPDSHSKISNLLITDQSCFIHIFLMWTEVLFIQGISGVYTSRFLDTNGFKRPKSFRVFRETGLRSDIKICRQGLPREEGLYWGLTLLPFILSWLKVLLSFLTYLNVMKMYGRSR